MNAIVADTVTALLTQGNLGEEFRADFTKAVAAVYAAGAATAQTVVNSAPLSAAEIELIRAMLKA